MKSKKNLSFRVLSLFLVIALLFIPSLVYASNYESNEALEENNSNPDEKYPTTVEVDSDDGNILSDPEEPPSSEPPVTEDPPVTLPASEEPTTEPPTTAPWTTEEPPISEEPPITEEPPTTEEPIIDIPDDYKFKGIISEDEQWLYSLKEGKATLIQYKGTGSKIIFPAEIDGHSVVAVGDNTFNPFYDIIPYGTYTSITLEEGIERINPFYFRNTQNVEELNLPSTLNYIGFTMPTPLLTDDLTFTFSNSKWFANQPSGPVIVGDGILLSYKTIGSPSSITLPEGIKTIAAATFDCQIEGQVDYSNLTELHLPNSITEIRPEHNLHVLSQYSSPFHIYYGKNVNTMEFFLSYGAQKNFVFHGYSGTAVEEYALKYGVTFIPIEDEPEEPGNNTQITVENPDTGAKVTGDLPTNTVLVTEKITACQEYNQIKSKLEKEYKDITVLEIHLKLVDKEFQPDSKVTVSIPVDSSYSDPQVFRLESDGSLTNMNATLKDGVLTFTTDHFSYYAIVGNEIEQSTTSTTDTEDTTESTTESSSDTETTDTESTTKATKDSNKGSGSSTKKNSTSPKTGDTSSILPILSLLIVSGLVYVGLVVKSRITSKK